MDEGLWPHFFELNVVLLKPYRERTVFVWLRQDGASQWEDFSGRMGRRGTFGGFEGGPDGLITHSRGDRKLTAEEEEAERREFTIRVEIPEVEFAAVRALIERVGRPWGDGWDEEESMTLHRLLEAVYWEHVNRFMHEPFDPPSGET